MKRTLGTLAWTLASVMETVAVRRLRLEPRWPPLFIVGGPRSGTTAVYLHLLNCFDFAYFPNIAKAHPRACVLAAWWCRARGVRYRPTYSHDYGLVEGAAAPSDGWDVFHRWFPRYDHTRPVAEVRLHELRTIVRLYERIFSAPFANKNNSNSVRIGYLADLFPRALFIYVHRDLTDTALSLIEARRTHDVPLNAWWSASPPRFLGRRFTDDVEQAAYQAWGVDRTIGDALARLPADRWRRFDYTAVCAEPGGLERWVSDRYAAADVPLRRRPDRRPADLRSRSRRRRDAELAARVDRFLARIEREHGDGGADASALQQDGGAA